MPPSPTERSDNEDTLSHYSSSFKQKAANCTSSYLAARSTPPQVQAPLILDSPFTRQTSIRMANDRNRYSIKMPSDDVPESDSPTPSRSSSSAFWRRRSYNDALEKSWKALKHESCISESSTHSQPSQTTPIATEFSHNSRSSSIRLTSFDFLIPFFPPRDGSRQSSHRTSMRTISLEKAHRRHSSPLIFGTDTVLSDALDRRSSTSSQKSTVSGSKSSNRSSVHMMATVKEYSKARQLQREHNQRGLSANNIASIPSTDFIETEALRILPLLRSANLSHFQGQANGYSNNLGIGEDGDDTAHATSQAGTGLAPQPQPHHRIGDMKKA